MDNHKISAIQCREAMHQPSPWLHHLSDGWAGLAAHSCGFPPLVGCIINTSISTAVAACREYAGSEGSMQDPVTVAKCTLAHHLPWPVVVCQGWEMLLRFTIREYSVDSQGWLLFARCPLVEKYQRPVPHFSNPFLALISSSPELWRMRSGGTLMNLISNVSPHISHSLAPLAWH